MHLLRFTFLSVLTFALMGCENNPSATTNDGVPTESGAEASGESYLEINGERVDVPESGTIERGGMTITVGTPKLTEDKEKEIYKSLSFKRKMASSARTSGARQNAQNELDLITKSFMARYEISKAEIEAIMAKGDANGWK